MLHNHNSHRILNRLNQKQEGGNTGGMQTPVANEYVDEPIHINLDIRNKLIQPQYGKSRTANRGTRTKMTNMDEIQVNKSSGNLNC